MIAKSNMAEFRVSARVETVKPDTSPATRRNPYDTMPRHRRARAAGSAAGASGELSRSSALASDTGELDPRPRRRIRRWSGLRFDDGNW